MRQSQSRLAILATLRGVRRKDCDSAEDTLECVERCLFAKPQIISTLYYDAFDRFTHRAELLPHTDIQAKMRSRKGSISPIVLQVGELLPRGGIFNVKRRGKTELNIFTESLVVTTLRHLSLHRPFQARSRGWAKRKHFARAAKPL